MDPRWLEIRLDKSITVGVVRIHPAPEYRVFLETVQLCDPADRATSHND
jgi:hypothetical protein